MSMFETKDEANHAEREDLMLEAMRELRDALKAAEKPEDKINLAKQMDSIAITYLGYSMSDKALTVADKGGRRLSNELKKLKDDE